MDIIRAPITFIIILSIIICTTLYGCSVTSNNMLEAATLSSSRVNSNVMSPTAFYSAHTPRHVFSAFHFIHRPLSHRRVHTSIYTDGNNSTSKSRNSDVTQEQEGNTLSLGDVLRYLWWIFVQLPFSVFCVLPIKLIIASLTDVYPGDMCLSIFIIIGCGTHLELLLSSNHVIYDLKSIGYSALVVIISFMDLIQKLLFFDNRMEEMNYLTLESRSSNNYSDEGNIANDDVSAAKSRRLALLAAAGIDEIYPNKFIQLLILQFIIGVFCFSCALAFSLQAPSGIIGPFIQIIVDDPITLAYAGKMTLGEVGVVPSTTVVALVLYFTRRLIVCPIFVQPVSPTSSNTASSKETDGNTLDNRNILSNSPTKAINPHSRRLSNGSEVVSRGSRTPSPCVTPSHISDTTAAAGPITEHRPQQTQTHLRRVIQYLRNLKVSCSTSIVRPHPGACHTNFLLFNSYGFSEALPGFISTEPLLKHVTDTGEYDGTEDELGANVNPLSSVSAHLGAHSLGDAGQGGSSAQRLLHGVFQAGSMSSVVAMDCLALHLMVVIVFRHGTSTSSSTDGAISNVCRVLLPSLIISHISVLVYRALLLDRHDGIVKGNTKDGDSRNGQRSCLVDKQSPFSVDCSMRLRHAHEDDFNAEKEGRRALLLVKRSRSRRSRLLKKTCYYVRQCTVLGASYLRASVAHLHRVARFTICGPHNQDGNNNRTIALREGIRASLTVEWQEYLIRLVSFIGAIEQKCDGLLRIVILLYGQEDGLSPQGGNENHTRDIISPDRDNVFVVDNSVSSSGVSLQATTPTFESMIRIRAGMAAVVDPPSFKIDNVTITFTNPMQPE